MKLLEDIKEGANATSVDLNKALKHLPPVLLLEELVFRVIPFFLLPLHVAMGVSLFSHLASHAYDRNLHKTNSTFAVFFLIIQSILATILNIIYIKYGLLTSFFVHLFYDYILILICTRDAKPEKGLKLNKNELQKWLDYSLDDFVSVGALAQGGVCVRCKAHCAILHDSLKGDEKIRICGNCLLK